MVAPSVFGDVEIAGDLVEMLLEISGTDFGRGIEGMADLDRFSTRSISFRFEVFTDRLLHQEARRGGAALAIDRIDHEDHRIERAVQIRVVEDDDRVLAAKFQMRAFQRVGALLHDHRAGAAFADEGDRLDIGMLGQRLAGLLAEPLTTFRHAGRQACLLGDLDQERAVIGESSRPVCAPPCSPPPAPARSSRWRA